MKKNRRKVVCCFLITMLFLIMTLRCRHSLKVQSVPEPAGPNRMNYAIAPSRVEPLQESTSEVAPVPPSPAPAPAPAAPKTDSLTTSCYPVPFNVPDVNHAFNEREFQKSLDNPKINVVIVHGDIKVETLNKEERDYLSSNFRRELLHVEDVPIFLYESNNCNNISKADLANILSGEITRWEQLGCSQGRIQIYLHGGELQRKSAKNIFKTLDVQPGKLAETAPKYLNTYKELAAVSARDTNALVIGLRNLQTVGLKVVSIEGIPIRSEAYPIRLPVYLYTRNGASDTRSFVIEQIRQREL